MYADAIYRVWIATTAASMKQERRTNIQMSTHLQQQHLQDLASLQWPDHSGKFYIDEFNLSPYPITTRLMSTTAAQHELRNATQTQPGLEPMPKAQPGKLSSTQNGKVEMKQSRRSSTLLLFARFGDCARRMPFHPPLVFNQAYNCLSPEPEPILNQSRNVNSAVQMSGTQLIHSQP